jgi:predicted alpha-1,2-mannosidase
MYRLIRYLLWVLAAVVLNIFAVYACYQWRVSQRPGQMNATLCPGELGKWVNPFIGTGGFPPYTSGYDMPGATVPFGMVRLSPDTRFFLKSITKKTMASTAGYYYGDNRCMGFSHTRLVGTGASDGGHFRVYPATGDKSVVHYRKGKYHRFSHRRETAFPGYYAVWLKKPGIIAELTATHRTGIHRYTFSGKDDPRILIDVASSIGKGRTTDGEIHVSPDGEITGAIQTYGNFAGRYGGQKVFFAARFDKAFSGFSFWSGEKAERHNASIRSDTLGIEFLFHKTIPAETEVIELRLGISYVSIENARENVAVETAGLTFEEIQQQAAQSWEEKLSLLKITGGTDEQKTIFYSALYRALQMPTGFNDVNGDYKGFDKQIHKAEGFRYFTDLSLWDTFRTNHPLYTLILPDYQRDMIISLVKMSEQGGWLPRWPSGYGYTGSMLGSSADIVISEAYQKGIRDFDVETAYRAMWKAAMAVDIPEQGFKPRPGTDLYMEYGYCPAESMRQAVSKTIEYAWADDAISKLAAALGHTDDAVRFAQRACYYRNVWNPETRFFQARYQDGSFQQQFDPLKLTYLDPKRKYTDAYVEGSAWQWRWAPFFDAPGLISLFGDTASFVGELTHFFEKAKPKRGAIYFGSYYWHGNEPDIHAAYLFNYAGRPDLTQKWVRWILDHKYGAGHDGVDGDDDAGTLSAWYVLSALGFYPVAGSDVYQIGAPLFEKAEIQMGDKRLTIVANHYSPENKYVQSVQLNGQQLDRWWFKHDEIAEGGTLVFEMSAR